MAATGTGLRRPGARDLPVPFTSAVVAEDLGKLLAAGWAPAALVVGVGAVNARMGCTGARWTASLATRQVVQLSEAAQAASRLAVADLEAEAAMAGDGVVDVHIDREVHREPNSAILHEIMLVGSVVRRFAPPADKPVVAAVVALSDRDRRRPATAPASPSERPSSGADMEGKGRSG